jgi:hypothetical protein
MKRRSKVTAALEAKPNILELVQLAWKRWVPEQRRSYLRGLMLAETDPDIIAEGKWLMEICNHYG